MSSKKSTASNNGIEYTAVATAVNESPIVTDVDGMNGIDLHKPAAENYGGHNHYVRTVNPDFAAMIPESQGITWEDDFFDDDFDSENIVAVFDFDYEMMESFYASIGWASYAASMLYFPIFWAATIFGTPCYLRKNVKWNVYSQHVAVTRDGIRFVKDKRPQCWGLPCTDAGKSSKTVPFDKITDCDIEEPAGNSMLCIKNVLCTVNVDTASSNQVRHELVIAGLKNPHEFKRLVWAMKRSSKNSPPQPPPPSFEMVDRKTNGNESENIASLLRDIRDELRELKITTTTAAQQQDTTVSAQVPTPTDPELV
mmetsp:Transcript_2115/g.2968  ORF Transcript_2115/g.2968 Transcript_2115/m.2968 type:complete len:311 (+) Transcript_2115:54-986(+)